MKIITWDKEKDVAITPERMPNHLEWAAFIDGKKVTKKQYKIPAIKLDSTVKEDVERQWRDSEILRTDKLVVLPDYPVDLLVYRTLLRDYPDSVGFPDGERPVV